LDSPLLTALLLLAALAPAMLLAGATLFALYAPEAAATLPRALALAAAVLLLAAVAARTADAALALGDPADPQPFALSLRTLLLETGFGRAWGAQLVLAALLLAALLARAPAALVLLLAAACLAAQAWIGHAAAGTGVDGTARLASMAVHLLAAGAWLGGLVPLGLTLRTAQTTLQAAKASGGEAAFAAAAAALRRFSRMGYVAVGLILLSGVANTWFVVSSVRVFAPAYASVLALKLVLAAGLVSLALANRTVLLPRVDGEGERDPAALAALGRNVLLEQALGLLVVLAAGLLGSLPPSS
jgi:putative copper resistance protein D